MASPFSKILLAIGYALMIMAFEATRSGSNALRWAEPVRRTSFTNYVAQLIVLGFVFYGYGLGMFGKLDVWAGLVLVCVIYGAQVIVSRWWLKRFRFGPLQWLWRALTYGQRPVGSG